MATGIENSAYTKLLYDNIIMSIADSESQWFSCNWSSGGNHFCCFTNNGTGGSRHTWQVIVTVVTEGQGSLNNMFFLK